MGSGKACAFPRQNRLRVAWLRKHASFLLPLLSGLVLTAWTGAAIAQSAEGAPLLRGLDTNIDGPFPARRRSPGDASLSDPLHPLRGRSAKTVVVSPKVKGAKPQDIRPNAAVAAPTPPVNVAPVCVAAEGATAQAPITPPALPALGLAPPPLRGTIRSRADDYYAPVGTRVGNIRLDMNADQQVGYDDNTARSTGDQPRRPSAFYREGGELRLRSDWSQHELSGEVGGGYSWYPSAKEANRPDLNSRLGLRLDLSRDTQLNFETKAVIDTQSPNSPDLSLTPAKRPLTYVYDASAGITQRYNRLVLDLRGTFERSTFDSAELPSGGILDQGDRNLNDYIVNLRAGYELKPGLTPFIEGTADTRQYDRKIDNTGFERSSNGGSLKVGTSFEISRLLTGQISVGYGQRSYEDTRLADLRGPIADASIVWAATPLTTLTLRGTSSFDETTLIGSSGAVVRRIALDLNHQLLRNLAIGANIAFSDTDYQGISRQDDVVTGVLRAEYRLDRHWSARVSYTHERSLSNVIQSGYTSNIWMLGLKADL